MRFQKSAHELVISLNSEDARLFMLSKSAGWFFKEPIRPEPEEDQAELMEAFEDRLLDEIAVFYSQETGTELSDSIIKRLQFSGRI